MSQAAVEQVLGKMLLHADFRKAMASDMSATLAGYDLTEGELDAFMKMDLQDFDHSVTGLDERVSKGISMQ